MLQGVVLQTDTEGMFALLLPNGQLIELSIDATQSYQEIEPRGNQRVVQLQILASALQDQQREQQKNVKDPSGDPIKDPNFDTTPLQAKELTFDTLNIKDATLDTYAESDKITADTSAWLDKVSGGDTHRIKDVGLDTQDTLDKVTTDTVAWYDKAAGGDTHRIKDVALDTQDMLDKITSDTVAWFDKLTSETHAWLDQQGTNLKEVADEAPPDWNAAQAQANLTPFVLATPHHAPQASLMAQRVAGAVPRGAETRQQRAPAALKNLLQDPLTLKELIKDPIQDSFTLKELIKDPIQDPITWVENINSGTLVENTGANWSLLNLPGGNPFSWR
jgi:hypothetical protein